jgi:hypothetical protein
MLTLTEADGADASNMEGADAPGGGVAGTAADARSSACGAVGVTRTAVFPSLGDTRAVPLSTASRPDGMVVTASAGVFRVTRAGSRRRAT